MVETVVGAVMFAMIDASAITALAEWLVSISWEAWPQQPRLVPDQIRPAFVQDPEWHGFYKRTEGLVQYLAQLAAYRTATSSTLYSTRNRWLSVVMPGARIDAHRDVTPSDRLARVHVPIMTNPHARFIVDGEPHWMRTGCAYLVDTSRLHEIRNDGQWPRVHLMFDVHRGSV